MDSQTTNAGRQKELTRATNALEHIACSLMAIEMMQVAQDDGSYQQSLHAHQLFLTTPTASRVGPERGTEPKPANRGPFQTLKVPDQGYPARALNRFPWDTATLDFEISPTRIIIASGGDPPEISGALGLPHRQPRLGQPHLPSR